MSSHLDNLKGPFIAKRVRDAIVLNLRRIFTADSEYTYSENPDGTVNFDCTKITINDATPEDHLSFPSIVVATLAGEETRFLQEDFVSSTEDSGGTITETRGAPIKFITSVKVKAIDTIARDEILDRIYRNFKIITDDLADNGVGLIKTSLEADSREFIQDRWHYTSGVRMDLYGEWLECETVTTKISGVKGQISTEFVNQEFRP